MKLDGQSLEYLHGKKFSNSLVVPYDYYEEIPNRVQFLTSLVKGKKVIHLGCLDHLPLIDAKIKAGQWLHKELTESADRCLGVDIDRETKEYVEKKHGYKNIILGDFTEKVLDEITSAQWDYAILGEILEHIDNPVAYLGAIRKLYGTNIREIVITVPNAWTQTAMRMANASAEIINSDHRYWFTPYTLAKVIVRAGMEIQDLYFANRVPLSTVELAKARLSAVLGQKLRYNFTYASSIVAIARMTP
jgi:2-polyprenyl-3-methyl-5-hydroxy-6-metoxy-1,4-benzoquinol methylase